MKTPITTTVLSILTLALMGGMSLKANDPGVPAPAPDASAKGCGHGHKKLSVLNEQERAQLKAAMKQVKNDPGLVAARQSLKDARTPEEKVAARETLHRTRRDLLLNVDPSLAPVLDKLRASKAIKNSVS